jgi:predicted phage tail protein
MVDITLKGILGKQFGSEWKLNVSSVLEIFEAIEANTSKVSKCFYDLQKFATHFIVFIDGKAMPSYLLNSNILKKNNKVEILPIVQGSGAAVALFIIGVLLTVASVVITKMLSPKAPKDVKTNSTILGGIRNVTARNIVVPIGYGRLKLGSSVISNYISVSDLSNQSSNSNPSGGFYVTSPYDIKENNN